MAQGKAEIVEDVAEKCRGLSLLMERQSTGAPHKFEFTPEQAATVTVFKITSTNFTDKAKAE